MNLRRLSSALTVALAMSVAGPACDDSSTPKTDASTTGGRGGSSVLSAGGSGGATGGRGGSGGATGGTGGAAGGSGGAAGGSGGAAGGSGGSAGGSGGAAGGTGGATGGTGGATAGTGGATGGTGGATGGTGGSPAPDMATMPDLPPDLPPDMPSGGTVTVTACSQINCPALTSAAMACDASAENLMCTTEVEMEDPIRVQNYCHSNGVKKFARTTYSGSNGENYHTVMRVTKPTSGDACYTLDMTGNDNMPVENWIFKSTSGAELARGLWNKDTNVLTLICGGVNYVIDDVGCPGTDGQPDDDECTAGTCQE
jgi:hypothetical protein